jgi:hypothetical protein
MLRMKRKITVKDCTDIGETADAFKWVFEKHMMQLDYQLVDYLKMDVKTIEQEHRRVRIRLRPDPCLQHVEYDENAYPCRVPSAQIRFELPPLSRDQEVTLLVALKRSEPETATWELAEGIFDEFIDYLHAKGYKVQEWQGPMPSEDSGAVSEQLTLAEDEVGKKHGPTVKTQIRAKAFKQLKDEHPEWSQAKVAIEACDKLGEYVTADTVRNAYRAMGWEWKRADRIR